MNAEIENDTYAATHAFSNTFHVTDLARFRHRMEELEIDVCEEVTAPGAPGTCVSIYDNNHGNWRFSQERGNNRQHSLRAAIQNYMVMGETAVLRSQAFRDGALVDEEYFFVPKLGRMVFLDGDEVIELLAGMFCDGRSYGQVVTHA